MIEINFAQLDFPGRDFFGGCQGNRLATVYHDGEVYSLVLPPNLKRHGTTGTAVF